MLLLLLLLLRYTSSRIILLQAAAAAATATATAAALGLAFPAELEGHDAQRPRHAQYCANRLCHTAGAGGDRHADATS